MNDLERDIRRLGRPSPSKDLDDRVGQLLMQAEWEQTILLRRKLVALVGLVALTTSAAGYLVGARIHSVDDRAASQVHLGASPKGNSSFSSLQPEVLITPELQKLVATEQPVPSLFGTDTLQCRVQLRDEVEL